MKLFKKLLISFVIALTIVAMFNVLFNPLAIEDNKVQYVKTTELSNLPDNCIDVAFIGSCQLYRNINPAVLWNNYNITSYILGSPDQKTYISYHYLKEMLKTQKPKVLIYDPLMLVRICGTSSYDFSVACSFPLSKNKFQLSDDTFVFNYQGNKSSPNFYFERLSNLLTTLMPAFNLSAEKMIKPDDVSTYFSKKMDGVYLGCHPHFKVEDCSSFTDYMNSQKSSETVNEDYETYFKKIYDICQEEGIKLILVKTITVEYWNYKRHDSVSELARKYGLEFIDYNIDYEKYGFDLSKHFNSKQTLNALGMEHTTNLVGKYLVENYPMMVNSEKSEETSLYYNNVYKEYLSYYNEHATW